MADLTYIYHWEPSAVDKLTFQEIIWWNEQAGRIAKEEKKAIDSAKSKR